MKTLSIPLFSYSELSESAQKRVLQDKAQNVDTEYTSGEILDSIKAICEACNLQLKDYAFGSYCRNWKLKVENWRVEDMEGKRALAWFARILMKHGYDRPTFKEGKWSIYCPGVCGFTGVCWDENVIESVWKALCDGETVRKAFDRIAYDAGQWLEKEEGYLRTPDAILEYLDQDEEIYTEDGETY